MSDWRERERPVCPECGDEMQLVGWGYETAWYCGGCDLEDEFQDLPEDYFPALD